MRRLLYSLTAACWLSACANYDLAAHLENPGTGNGGAVGSCSSACRIFVSAVAYSGNLGGIPGADAKCQNDSNRPLSVGGQWRALLSATDRKACVSASCPGGQAENLNWVLRANTTYYRTDNSPIGQTNGAGLFNFNLTQPIADGAGNVWTGTYADWTSASLTDRCNDWSDSGTTDAIYALSGSTTATAIGNFHINCSNLHRLYCVEQ
ncbi:DUF1554 domain-containing protein [Turneriella parva]|uniref:DUF1554 domain-containing protein n=1 Tax=Turneriella parva (strain ATCC BAA-1111 / DSM 21527 / NCTC 11395 / H) TaxID=869212 RepID=I4B2M2_TURPD|nr:DUF1554 domain-containing protein [Turneriella parva]AFM11529.1 protein of unknown function DUF1554 [Turneriella parva DSM 21527]